MLPPWLEALILGIVQGLTEFIPVSSSGHLVLVPYLAGWDKPSLAFDVMLHAGTLGAVLLYFRAELVAIARGILRLDTSPQGLTYRRVGLYILPASVPVAIVGLTLRDRVEQAFESPLLASSLLLVTASLLLATEAVRTRRVRRALPDGAPTEPGTPTDVRGRAGVSGAIPVAADEAAGTGAAWSGDWRATTAETTDDPPHAVLPTGADPADPTATDLSGLTLKQAMVVGLFQCLAVLPGISRSGATIAAGVFSGLSREAATRFTFMLVIPALAGATVLSLPDLAEGGETAPELVAGVLAAFVSSYLAIRFLVALVSRERLTGFAYYCIAASIVGLIGYAMIGPPSAI
jgi:undecaprenyl-diphosphatase